MSHQYMIQNDFIAKSAGGILDLEHKSWISMFGKEPTLS